MKIVQKGKAGEVEFCNWLKNELGIDAEREYNQSQGGADIIIKDFIIEVKRRESLDLPSWWYQVIVAAKRHKEELIPVVAFRQNRKSWEFLLPASLIIGVKLGYIRCSQTVFLQLAEYVIGKNNMEVKS